MFCRVPDPANHVATVYGDGYFLEGESAGYPNYLDEADILLRHGVNYAKLLSSYTKPGSMLDVGCAAGFILKGFEKQGWTCTGLEPNAAMAAYGRENLDLNILVGSLEAFVPNEKYELVTLIQVIGHFYDLDKAITNVSQSLVPGGLLLVESWNRDSLMARIMGRHWHEFSPPSVIHWFSDQTLAELMAYYGLLLVGSGQPEKRISLKHAAQLIDDKMPNLPLKSRLLGRFSRSFGSVSLNYPAFDLKWYLFQKPRD